jgi:hypothetical protein
MQSSTTRVVPHRLHDNPQRTHTHTNLFGVIISIYERPALYTRDSYTIVYFNIYHPIRKHGQHALHRQANILINGAQVGLSTAPIASYSVHHRHKPQRQTSPNGRGTQGTQNPLLQTPPLTTSLIRSGSPMKPSWRWLISPLISTRQR